MRIEQARDKLVRLFPGCYVAVEARAIHYCQSGRNRKKFYLHISLGGTSTRYLIEEGPVLKDVLEKIISQREELIK